MAGAVISRRQFLIVTGMGALTLLSGCGRDVSGAKKAVESYLDALSSFDDAEELLGDHAGDLDSLGISAEDFFAAFFAGFSYEVGEASGDGDTATVPVTITSRVLSDVFGAMGDAYTDLSLENPNHSAEESELYGIACQALNKALAQTQPKQSQADVVCSYDKGEWSVSDDGKQAVLSILLGS